jgi:hypothetical protein
MSHPLRYVVLHHTGTDDPHFDLMFETAPGSTLATWRSSHWPIQAGSTLTPIADHRSIYLEYEGQISNNRGAVRQIASGTHEVVENSEAHFVILLNDGSELRLPRSC